MLKLFKFTWSDNASAGVVNVVARTREQAQAFANEAVNRTCEYDEEFLLYEGMVTVVTTEQNPG